MICFLKGQNTYEGWYPYRIGWTIFVWNLMFLAIASYAVVLFAS